MHLFSLHFSHKKHVIRFLACILLEEISRNVGISKPCDDRGSRVRFPAGTGNFSLYYHVQNGSGAHPDSYTMGNRGPFSEGKAAEA
jgi:hypothetical protein